MKEEKEVETKETQDTDSGNNTADSCSDCEERKSLLTPLVGKEEVGEGEKEDEDEGGLVEAQKPRFNSPVWLEDIHSNKLFNKQKSILTEEVRLFPCYSMLFCPEKPKS